MERSIEVCCHEFRRKLVKISRQWLCVAPMLLAWIDQLRGLLTAHWWGFQENDGSGPRAASSVVILGYMRVDTGIDEILRVYKNMVVAGGAKDMRSSALL